MNWNQDNTITRDMAAECYDAESIAELFTNLETEGYSGLSLGLIIDLIRRETERVN